MVCGIFFTQNQATEHRQKLKDDEQKITLLKHQ
jgi:hypothetical protein